MKNISIIFPARNNIKAFYDLMNNIIDMTENKDSIEVLCAVDTDDDVFIDLVSHLESKFNKVSLKIFPREKSEYFTKDYWNFLANKCVGRFIVNTALGCKIETKGWDKIIFDKMEKASNLFGDDIIHGLIRDNIPRYGENPKFPNFSCHPVVSRKHIEVLGYLFDERYWCWGCDPAITILYRMLNNITHQERIVSLTDVYISAEKDIHTTTQKDLNNITREIGMDVNLKNTEFVLRVLRLQNNSYQKFLKISQNHPYTMTDQDALTEAEKLKDYIISHKNEAGSHGLCGHQKIMIG